MKQEIKNTISNKWPLDICNTTIWGAGKKSLVCTLPKGHEGKCGIIGCECPACKESNQLLNSKTN